MKYRVEYERDEDGMIVATCPVLPGCVSQGRTIEEARANIREAIALYLESLRAHGEAPPPGVESEVIEVAEG